MITIVKFINISSLKLPTFVCGERPKIYSQGTPSSRHSMLTTVAVLYPRPLTHASRTTALVHLPHASPFPPPAPPALPLVTTVQHLSVPLF